MSSENDKASAIPDVENNALLQDNLQLIVIGASAGGFEVLRDLISRLPPEFNAAILIVWHMAPTINGVLPQVLNKNETIYAAHGYDKDPLIPRRIYVAPPDRHMIVERGRIRITRGPKENRFRPAIDPLFRSAALTYGPRVVGIILSGALDDGTAGLWAVKKYGGTAIVQDPMEAQVRSMPENALREVDVDYCLPVAEIANVLKELVQKNDFNSNEKPKNERLELEIKIAKEENAFNSGFMKFGDLTPFTCPECNGVLKAIRDGNIERYRCHTGHAFSADTLLDAITEGIEAHLYSAIRGVDESVMLLNHMGDHFAEKNKPKIAAMFFQKANEAQDRASIMRQAVLDHEQLTQQNIVDEIRDEEDAGKK